MSSFSTVIEIEGVVSERFARTVAEYAAPPPNERIGQRRVGRFEMALQTDFHLADGVELGWVDDGGADCGGRLPQTNRIDVALPRPVATLAIDACRQLRRPDRGVFPLIG